MLMNVTLEDVDCVVDSYHIAVSDTTGRNNPPVHVCARVCMYAGTMVSGCVRL